MVAVHLLRFTKKKQKKQITLDKKKKNECVMAKESCSVSGDYLPHIANIKKSFMLKFPKPAACFMPL